MPKESCEVGVIAFVVDNETRVYGHITCLRLHRDGVAMATCPISSFVDSNVMDLVQEPSTAQSGYAAANNRYSHHATI